MSTPVARGNSGSPEPLPAGRRSRLAIPRDWKSSSTRRRSEEPVSSTDGGVNGRKYQQSPLEMDGEWFGDALDPAGVFEKEPEQGSAAMSLLCSITKASANAVPEICSPPMPLTGGLRQPGHRQHRSRGSSVNSTGSGAAANGEDGEYYRLPWYRRPLPSNRNTSGSGGEAESKRKSSMLVAPRAGLRPPRVNTSCAMASAGSSPAAGGDGKRASGHQQEQRGSPDRHVGTPPELLGGVEGAGPASESRLKAASGALPQPPARSFASAIGGASDKRPIVQQAATSEILSTAGAMDATPRANSMEADRGTIIPDDNASSRRARSGGILAATMDLGKNPRDKGSEADQVVKLRAELSRLKRDMASMAAAAATASAPTTHQKERVHDRHSSPMMDISSPSSRSRCNQSNWEEHDSLGSEEESGSAKGARPQSARLRADDSWREFRRGSNHSHSDKQSPQSDGNVASNVNGFGGRTVAGSVLPALGSDSSRRESKVSDEEGRGHAEGDALLFSPPAHGVKAEGPSPASGEKSEETKAIAAGRRRSSSRTGVVEEEGNDGGGKREATGSNGSMRQISVFFPFQQGQPKPNAGVGEADSSAPGAEGAAALACAAATPIAGSNVPSEANHAAQTARDAFSARQQEADTKNDAVVPNAATPLNNSAARGSTGTGTGALAHRQRGPSDSSRRVWLWVLAQRMANQAVLQALMKNGLPLLGRRHIWAAWAAAATPELYSNFVKIKPDAAKAASVMSVIMHDVTRTKIVHPLFEREEDGLAMLKRVLLRCAELRAVKEAGYIQGMNYLAGFLLITLADGIMSERDGVSLQSSQVASGGGGGDGGVDGDGDYATRPVDMWVTTREPNLPPDLELPPPAKVDGVSSSLGGGIAPIAEEDVGESASRAEVVEKEGKRGSEDVKRRRPTDEEATLIESDCIQVMRGVIALQGGVLSRDLWGLHANTELLEDLLSSHCPDIMEHLKGVNLELIVLTPRWFICIFAGSMGSQAVVTRIWDLFMWHGRRGPAVLVWVALGLLRGCRRVMFESKSLPATVKAVRRHAEACKTFDDLVRQAPLSLPRVVAAWEEYGVNRRIAALDGDGVISDNMAALLIGEMTGEPPVFASSAPPEVFSTPRQHNHHRTVSNPSVSSAPPPATSTGFGIQFPSTPGRPTTPLTSPRSPFPEWAANIFRSSTGGLNELGEGGGSGYVDRKGEGGRAGVRNGGGTADNLPPTSPRYSTPAKTRQLRRSASASWW